MFFSTSFAGAQMTISSPDFREGKFIKNTNAFNAFGCSGENISPAISIKDIPSNAKSLAITIYDPDAPTGSGWWHWVVYNVPTNVTDIVAGEKIISKEAVFGKNDYGTFKYGGPCPPAGQRRHRYVLSVYALLVETIDLPKDASPALIGYNINSNLIEKASITSYYQR